MRSRATIRIAAGALRGLAAAALSVAALLLLVFALVLVQSQRDETRPAAAAVVLPAEEWRSDRSAMRQARLDHVLELYQSGIVSRIILTGAAAGGSDTSEAALGSAYLVERGVPAEVLALEDQGATTLACVQAAVARARAGGAGTVLLVSDPTGMLRALKMARDTGIAAYGSPTITPPAARSLTSELGYVARETLAYLGYILLRR